MDTINIPLKEYEALKEEINLLKDKDLLRKINRLIDLLFLEKYGLYMGEYTGELTEKIIEDNYTEKESGWDRI